MKPVMQTKFGYPYGNCLAAALASVLELELRDVPDFCTDDDDDSEWFDRMQEWLAKRGLCVVHLNLEASGALPPMPGMIDGTWCIVGGRSPRGDWDHSVVGRYRLVQGGHAIELVHDPHPDGGFLKYFSDVQFFVLINPQRQKGGDDE